MPDFSPDGVYALWSGGDSVKDFGLV